MADKDQKYFVSVEVKWGKDDGKGNKKAESVGGQTWGELSYGQSVAVQSGCVIPGVKLMFDKAGEMGVINAEAMGEVLPGFIGDES
jgi:hypothetical protein